MRHLDEIRYSLNLLLKEFKENKANKRVNEVVNILLDESQSDEAITNALLGIADFQSSSKEAKLLFSFCCLNEVGITQNVDPEALEPFAKENNMVALWALGYYHFRLGDFSKASEYLTKASDKGHLYARALLIEINIKGFDSNKRLASISMLDAEACKEFDSTEATSNGVFSYLYGKSYCEGSGIVCNPATGIKFLEKAVNLKYSKAFFALTEAYKKHSQADIKKCLELYTQGAKRHNPEALQALANIYDNGLGVKKDQLRAFY